MYCPSGTDSWCKWQQSASENTIEDFVHETKPLADNVLTVIKPIYDSL